MKVMDELIELNEEHTPDYCGFAGKPGGLIMANKSWHCLSNRGAFSVIKMSAETLFPASACFCLAVLPLSDSSS